MAGEDRWSFNLYTSSYDDGNYGLYLLGLDRRSYYKGSICRKNHHFSQDHDGQENQVALSKIVGRRTVPQVFIDGKKIGGSDDTFEAHQSGELAKLLGVDGEDDL